MPAGYAQASARPDHGKMASRVLKLSNMVTAEELLDDQEWREIREDVEAECSGHGSVTKVIIPRVSEGYSKASEGLIFVAFKDVVSAAAADKALQGRKFANRIVISEYYDEGFFNNGIL